MDPAPPRPGPPLGVPPRPASGGAAVFESVHHPGTTGRAYLALQAQARPVALALLGVMTVGLAAALSGESILWPFVTGTAVVYALAAAYGQSTLHRTPAEVEVRGPFMAVRSVWDVAGPGRGGLAPVRSARLVHGELVVGLGDYVTTLRREDWHDFDGLVVALRRAAQAAAALGGGAVLE